MSATTYGWLVLAFPLAGCITISLLWKVLPLKVAGWIGTAAIGLAFLATVQPGTQLVAPGGVHK